MSDQAWDSEIVWPVERLRVVLGPCRCQDCHALVYWARSDGWPLAWRNRDGTPHDC